MTKRSFITKAQQIMSARQKIATFRANENNPPVDYRTPLEKARQAGPDAVSAMLAKWKNA
jgi:hypothetical protein